MNQAARLVQQMTLEERVAQLFLIGFFGTDLPPALAEWIVRRGLGGLILFTRNVVSHTQVRALTSAAQAAAQASRQGLPLAIAADQEGGTVTRLAEAAGFTHLPGAMALGAADDPTLTYRCARVTGAEMRAVGINWNLAPVLDVTNNPANPVIGVRSFGGAPDLVTRHGLATIRGLHAANLAACAKHFPGHGDTTVDSHLDLPVILHDRTRLEAVELVPFRASVAAGIDAVMPGHLFFPALEPEADLPATLSPRVLQGLLRQEIGFEGVICTDCLEMKAIAERFPPGEIAVRAVQAGADLLLVSHTFDQQVAMYDAVLSAVRMGRISEEWVGQSAARILRMKRVRQMGEAAAGVGPGAAGARPGAPAAQPGAPDHQSVALQAARRAVTLVWGAQHLPLQGRVALVLPGGLRPVGAPDATSRFAPLQEGLRSAGLLVEVINCPLNMAGALPERVAAHAGPGGTVLFGVTGLQEHPEQRTFARRLMDLGCRLIVLARRMPHDLPPLAAAAAGLALYDDSPAMQKAATEVLTGRLKAEGQLPVSL